MPTAKKPAKKKTTVPANEDREEMKGILREIARFSEDDQARAIAAIGLAQLSHAPIH
jgi:hypothetical protein